MPHVPPSGGASPTSVGDGPHIAAFFDVDGTLSHSDVFRDLVRFRSAVRRKGHALWTLTVAFRGLLLLIVDKFSRTTVNRLTCSWYAGHRRDELAQWCELFQDGPGARRLYRRSLDLLARHAALGHRIVLITGAVHPIVAPLPRVLAREAGEPRLAGMRIEAIRLDEIDGVLTGALLDPPLGGEEKARRIARVAAEEGIDLAASYAYGDSIADLPMLLAVGRPAAVKPDRALRREARRRGWPVLDVGKPARPPLSPPRPFSGDSTMPGIDRP